MQRVQLTRRRALRLLGASGLLVVACQPVAPSAPPAATTPPTAVPPTAAAAADAKPAAASAPAAGQPRSGGTLQTALPSDITSLEGHLYFTWSFESTWLAFDRLIEYDEKLQPKPMLAESWDATPDFKQIKFNLRKGVQFHSGREFTSDDVKWNIVRARDPKVGAGQFSKPSAWYPTIDTPDKYTVVLTSDEPRPLAFDNFEYFNIVDKDAMEAPDAKEKLVGTGPFRFLEWVQGDHITFARNRNYWQSNRPYLDEVRVNVLRDVQAMIAQLEAGTVNLVRTPPLADVNRLRSDPKYQVVLHDHSGVNLGIGMSTYAPPLDDKRVRQALSYAIDRKRINDTALLGLGRPTSLPWLPGSAAYEAAKDGHYAFDLDKAKSLLNQANVSDLEIDIVMTGSAEGVIAGQIYQSDLAKIGVKLNVKDLAAATWADQVNNRKYRGQWWSTMAQAQLLPGSMLNGTVTWGPTSSNNTGYTSEAYTRIVAETARETDLAKQKQLYTEFNDVLLDDAWIAIVSPAVISYLAATRVRDLKPNWHNSLTLTDAWLEA